MGEKYLRVDRAMQDLARAQGCGSSRCHACLKTMRLGAKYVECDLDVQSIGNQEIAIVVAVCVRCAQAGRKPQGSVRLRTRPEDYDVAGHVEGLKAVGLVCGFRGDARRQYLHTYGAWTIGRLIEFFAPLLHYPYFWRVDCMTRIKMREPASWGIVLVRT